MMEGSRKGRRETLATVSRRPYELLKTLPNSPVTCTNNNNNNNNNNTNNNINNKTNNDNHYNNNRAARSLRRASRAKTFRPQLSPMRPHALLAT